MINISCPKSVPSSQQHTSHAAVEQVKHLMNPLQRQALDDLLSRGGNLLLSVCGRRFHNGRSVPQDGHVATISFQRDSTTAGVILEVYISDGNLDDSRSSIYRLVDNARPAESHIKFEIVPTKFALSTSFSRNDARCNLPTEHMAPRSAFSTLRALTAAAGVYALCDEILPRPPALKEWAVGGTFGAAIAGLGVEGPLKLK